MTSRGSATVPQKRAPITYPPLPPTTTHTHTQTHTLTHTHTRPILQDLIDRVFGYLVPQALDLPLEPLAPLDATSLLRTLSSLLPKGLPLSLELRATRISCVHGLLLVEASSSPTSLLMPRGPARSNR